MSEKEEITLKNIPASVKACCWRIADGILKFWPKIGIVIASDVFLDINSFDGEILTYVHRQVNCKTVGFSQSEANFLTASKDVYLECIKQKSLKDKIRIIKSEKEHMTEITSLNEQPSVIFFESTDDCDKEFVELFLIENFRNGAKIVTTELLDFLGNYTRTIVCKADDSNDVTLYFYKNTSGPLTRLNLFLDPTKNEHITTIFNIISMGFISFLFYLINEDFYRTHMVILMILTVILQGVCNWFLRLLKRVTEDLERDLQHASKILKLP